MLSAMLIFCAVAAQSVGVPGFSLGRSSIDSDVILVAHLVSVQGGATTVQYRDHVLPGRNYETTVSVLRVLKGSAPAAFSLDYAIPQQRLGIRPLENGTRLLFLKRQPDGRFALASQYYPSLPALESVASQRSISPLDAVMSELGAVLVSPLSSMDDKHRAARAGASDERFTPYLKQGVESTDDPQLRATFIGMLVGRGDTSYIGEYPKLLSDFTAQGPLRTNLLAAIRSMRDPAAIPVISTLLKSSDVEVRRQAVNALQDNQHPKAEQLLKASLQDSDPQIQLNAIHALAKRHNLPGWTLGMREFSEHRDDYVRSFSNLSGSQRNNR